jgi:hypothetical protein
MERKAAFEAATGVTAHLISGGLNEGVDALLAAVIAVIRESRAAEGEEVKEASAEDGGWSP